MGGVIVFLYFSFSLSPCKAGGVVEERSGWSSSSFIFQDDDNVLFSEQIFVKATGPIYTAYVARTGSIEEHNTDALQPVN